MTVSDTRHSELLAKLGGQGGEAVTVEGPDAIERFHHLQLKYALKLEMKGLRHSQGSVYAYVKRRFGLKGNRQKVYDTFCDKVGLDR